MRSFSSELTADIAKKAPAMLRVHLLEIQRADGQLFFWATQEGSFPSVITGSNQNFLPWLKGGQDGPKITLSRSLTSDFGEMHVQNLSGNTIDRPVSQAFEASEFEGAYCVFRRWFVPADEAGFEFHGFVSEPQATKDELTIRMLQLFQPNDISAFESVLTLDCNWRFTSAPCGYRAGQIFLGRTTATAFSANTIGSSGLTLIPDLYKGEQVTIVAGTGSGQSRIISTHTATTLTTATNWTTNPDGTSIFVIEGPGATKLARTTANIFSANTIGNSGLTRTVNADVDGRVWIVDGTGAGQFRQVASNTATTFSVSPAWALVPDGTSVFVVAYADCAKDRASCVTRGVVERFRGIIQLQSQVTQIPGSPGTRPGGGGSNPGGTGRVPPRMSGL